MIPFMRTTGMFVLSAVSANSVESAVISQPTGVAIGLLLQSDADVFYQIDEALTVTNAVGSAAHLLKGGTTLPVRIQNGERLSVRTATGTATVYASVFYVD